MAAHMIVHGHFYQPPRDNPWTGQIDPQPSAAPWRDWNERVHAEAYRPNAFSRVATGDGFVEVNNFERLSFNVGPTLLSWMAGADPDVYARIIEADRTSAARLGHGNALAQAFHHSILPLSCDRDVRTEIRWGLADFQYRFGRRAQGMWLPETAANDRVLSHLIQEGVSFTILAPHQAALWRRDGGRWHDVAEDPIDTRVPYRWMHPDGSERNLALFFYDGDISKAIAFENAGSSAERFVAMFADRAAERGVVHAATDGETYGHHHKFSELGLAYALFVEAGRRRIDVTNYGAALQMFPPQHEVRLVAGGGTSWSCSHGVERWRSNCGCHTGGREGWNQRWRRPLRAGLELVKDAADRCFDRVGHRVFDDPWRARDEYVDVVVGPTPWEEWIARVAPDAEPAAARRLLELQRNTLAAFTSCGWFFNDVAGIETVQVLRYAARALEILDELGWAPPLDSVLDVLAEADSNDPSKGTAADAFRGILRQRWKQARD